MIYCKFSSDKIKEIKMKKILLYVGVLMSAVLIMSSTTPESMSLGAPASSTGAPNEQTCAVSGCHSDHQLNAGTAQINFEVAGHPLDYEPGKIYTFKISVSDPNVVRFGFQLVALKNSDNSNIGEFMITEPSRTQLIQNDVKLLDRQYVTYTFPGTSAIKTGIGEWTVDWKAPLQDEGLVSFYLGAISANDDGTDGGDWSYTQSISLSSNAHSGIANTSIYQKMKWTYDNERSLLNVCVPGINYTTARVYLYDVSGKLLKTVLAKDQNLNAVSIEIPVTDVPKGTYLIKVNGGERAFTEKIIIY